MKILIHFHSEFILNQDGQFALILEERPHVNGVVNGLPLIMPEPIISAIDNLIWLQLAGRIPFFGKNCALKDGSLFISYSLSSLPKGRNEVGWEQSYFNQQGSFSYGGHSRALV